MFKKDLSSDNNKTCVARFADVALVSHSCYSCHTCVARVWHSCCKASVGRCLVY